MESAFFILHAYNMQYTSIIDNVTSKKWGLTLSEAYVFSYMANAATWATPLPLGNEVYYFVSKTLFEKELPLISGKKDTIYRYYKSFESKGIISVKKIDGKDYIKFQKKAAEWNSGSGFKSDNSEINPDELGFKSENNSEINPTYQCTIEDQCTSIISRTIALLNEKSNSGYKPTRKSTVSVIKARLAEGFTETDLSLVVVSKSNQWLKDQKMSAYLRPETLFGNKFEGYLNESLRAAAKPKTAAELHEERLRLAVRGENLNG